MEHNQKQHKNICFVDYQRLTMYMGNIPKGNHGDLTKLQGNNPVLALKRNPQEIKADVGDKAKHTLW